MQAIKRLSHCPLLAVILMAFFAALSSSFADGEPVFHRGKLLRVESRRVEKDPAFSCSLAVTQPSFVKLKFTSLTILTHHEVGIYEALREIVREKDKDGIALPGATEYQIMPDMTLEGEQTTRIEIQKNGPLSNETFSILGQKFVTDEQGEIVDRNQQYLAIFDNESTMSHTLRIAHDTLGEQSIIITRYLIKRKSPQTPGEENVARWDILDAFQLDFSQQTVSGRQGISFTACIKPAAAVAETKDNIPDSADQAAVAATAVPGERIAIDVTASNAGPQAVSNLIAGCFSRHAWLNGKLFYFGKLGPGQSVTFTRVINVPADAPNQPCHLAIAFWDILGPYPDQQQSLCLDIRPKP